MNLFKRVKLANKVLFSAASVEQAEVPTEIKDEFLGDGNAEFLGEGTTEEFLEQERTDKGEDKWYKRILRKE